MENNKYIEFINSLPPSVVMVLGMWLFMLFLRLFDWIVYRDKMGDSWGLYSLRAKKSNKLFSWFLHPFIHADWGHFLGNSWLFVLFGLIVALPEISEFIVATIVIIFIDNLGIWLFEVGEEATVGASGLVTGYFGYIMLRGFFLRDADAVIIALILGGVYFGLFRFIFAPQKQEGKKEKKSNVAHFFGFLGGIAAAWIWSLYAMQTIVPVP